MNKNKIIYGMMFLLLVFSVLAVPPQTDITISVPSLTIVYPKYDLFVYGESNIYPMDILNSTYGKLDNTSTTCTWYVSNNSGALEGTGAVIYDTTNKFWYFNVPEVSTIGDYGVYVYCSNVAESGFISELIPIKYSNAEPTAYISLVAILTVLIFAMFTIGLGLKDDHAPLKLFMYWLGILMFIPLAQVSVSIALTEVLAPNILTMANLFLYVTIFMGIFASGYFMIYLLTRMLVSASEAAKNELRRA